MKTIRYLLFIITILCFSNLAFFTYANEDSSDVEQQLAEMKEKLKQLETELSETPEILREVIASLERTIEFQKVNHARANYLQIQQNLDQLLRTQTSIDSKLELAIYKEEDNSGLKTPPTRECQHFCLNLKGFLSKT